MTWQSVAFLFYKQNSQIPTVITQTREILEKRLLEKQKRKI